MKISTPRWKKQFLDILSMDDNFCYVIDEYNKFQQNDNVVFTFKLSIGGHYEPWCIRKVPVSYFWGEPQIEAWPQQDWERDYSLQYAYPTKEAALEFIRFLKRRNG